jgi:GTPase SAR1 family protein
LIYDVTNLESFKNLAQWLEKIREYSDEHVKIALIGNKKDLVEPRDYSETFKDVIMDTEGNDSKVESTDKYQAKGKPTWRMESLQYEGGGKDSSNGGCYDYEGGGKDS